MPVVYKSIAAATLAAGGTAQKVTTTNQPAMRVYVTSPASNTGNIWIGDSSTLASTKRGLEVVKGTTQILATDDNDLFDLATIYFDGTTGDKCSITYLMDPAS